MSSDSDWEVRHPSTPFYVHTIAGSCAGISEHLFMLPFDNIKTHCQAGQTISIPQIAKKIYEQGGIRNFYTGSTVMAIGCIPAHGLYFSIYEYMMKRLGLNQHQDNNKSLYSLVGFTSSLFHDLILTPTEAVKQRLQLYRAEKFRTRASAVANRMFQNQGIRAFYKSFGVNYFMNVPFGALIVTINETLKHKYLDPNNSSLINYYLMAGIAGLLASVPTCPLDVIKTRLNVQHCMNKHCQNGSCTLLRNNQLGSPGGMSSHHSYDLLTHRIYRHAGRMRRHMRYNSVRDAALRIYREAGFLGFFKGLKMRVLIQSPSSAISWGTYETFKRLLTKKWEV